MPSKRRRRGKKGKRCAVHEEESGSHASCAQVSAPPEENELDAESEETSAHRETEIPETEEDSDTSMEALCNYLQQSLILSTPFAKRPDYGSRGDDISLIVNYFPLELPSGDVYHYDIRIILKRRDSTESTFGVVEPDKKKLKKFRCLNTRLNRKVFNEMLRQHREFDGYIPAYDGKRNLYTKTSLKKTLFKVPLMVELPTNDNKERPEDDPLPRGDMFEVMIKPVVKKETNAGCCQKKKPRKPVVEKESNAISLDSIHALYRREVNYVSLEAVMAIETILRNGPCFRHVPLGRCFFPWPREGSDDMRPLGGAKEIWLGYHQSVILTEWQPIINIDVTASIFFKSQPLITYVCEILKRTKQQLSQAPFLTDADVVRLTKKLKGVRVRVTHLKYERQYRIIRLTREAAKKLEFPMETSEGQKNKRVSDFFLERYNTVLKYSNLPCVQVQPEERKIYLPLEVCNIVAGQHVREQLSTQETSTMVKTASLPPEKRFRKIQDVLRQAQFNSDPCNKEFGIRVSSRPVNVKGRIILPPSIRYYSDKLVKPKNGSWKMRPEKFLEGASVNSWVLLSFSSENDCNINDLNSFADLLVSVGKEYGLCLENLECVRIFSNHHELARSVLDGIKTEFKDVKLAVVVLHDKSSSFYSAIKQKSEIVLGLTTQCVQASNVIKLDPSIVSNICLKINAKMGGINCSLTPGERPAIFEKPVVIVGADVTHPLPGSGCRPSIAAVVASLDPCHSRYATVLQTQKHTNREKKSVEIIQNLEQMVVDLLMPFFRETGKKKPQKIIFYRDGVSTGQLVEVRNYELRAVRNACERLEAGYKPGITFIVVQKKHHTSFIPKDPRDGVGPKRNIPPGTVVDRGVSNIIHFDFFLCSHFGLQGTSRASHYTVISDDNKFTSDELQKLTYYLCHIYSCCTKSISIPAPLKYAHLAAYRASKYLVAELGESSVSTEEISTAEFQKLLTKWKEITTICPQMKNTMYFV